MGLHEDYVTSIKDAMWFSDALEAKLYVEWRGIERITTVRKSCLQNAECLNNENHLEIMI